MKLALRFSIILLFTFFLVSCEEGIEITKIEVMHDSSEVIVLEDFKLSDLTLRITYSDNKFMEIPLSERMLSSNDLLLLSSVGNHTINVSFGDFETTVIIRLDYGTLTKQLRSFYTLSQTLNSFEGTYEEWLISIQGPAGKDGREVLFQVASGYIQWRYTSETVWTNLVEMTTLIGPKGDDGLNGENGIDGREVVFQVSNDYIQWKYEGENAWTNLVALETLTGEKGSDGLQVELRVS